MTEVRQARFAVLLGLALIGIAIFIAIRILSTSDEEVSEIEDPTFSLAVIGDFGYGGEDEFDVAEDVQTFNDREDLDALITTGDNVYPRGDRIFFERAWDEPYGWTETGDLDVIASLGNHDFDHEGGDAVVEHLGMPAYWYMQRVGDADIFVLDSNRVTDPEQQIWLSEQLARSSAAWQIAVFHHPAFSCSLHGTTQEIVDEWVPVFEREGVDLVVNGHDHNYQRFDGAEIAYVVTGGGGAPLYELEECEFEEPAREEADDEKHHFLSIEGGASNLRVRAIAVEGEALDDFSISENR
jgi:3',5'-cyclic AMP phosphodiesterase CpdA